MTRLTSLAPLLALLSVACTAADGPNALQASSSPSRAESVAALLADAEADSVAGETGMLARRLARLEALGAHPAPDGGEDPVPAWRTAAGNDSIPFRGRALGPAYRRGTLAADGELQLTQTFLSGKKAVIAVSSPGGAGPALRVVSASGETICESAASCRWTPVFTERYAIILRNTSRKARAYYLVVE